MSFWILTAAAGLIISAAGLLCVYRQRCAGEVSRRYFFAMLTGFLSLLAFALVAALAPDLSAGPTLAILLPGAIAVPVIIKERSQNPQ